MLKLGLAIWFVSSKDAKCRGSSKQSQIEELLIEVWCHKGIFVNWDAILHWKFLLGSHYLIFD